MPLCVDGPVYGGGASLVIFGVGFAAAFLVCAWAFVPTTTSAAMATSPLPRNARSIAKSREKVREKNSFMVSSRYFASFRAFRGQFVSIDARRITPVDSHETPAGTDNDQQQHHPSQYARRQRHAENRHLERILRQRRAPVEHPVPRGVRDERRQNDRPHPLGDHVPERKAQRRNRQ